MLLEPALPDTLYIFALFVPRTIAAIAYLRACGLPACLHSRIIFFVCLLACLFVFLCSFLFVCLFACLPDRWFSLLIFVCLFVCLLACLLA